MRNDPNFEPSLGEQTDNADNELGGFTPFLAPSGEELLEQLAYAAQFTAGVQAVEGPAGSGKTTLAAILQHGHLTQCAHVATLTASAGSGAVLAGAADAFNLPVGDVASAGESVAALRSFAQSLHTQSEVAVLMVDDAHLLDQKTLAALASLLQTGDDSVFGLHLVLWSEPGLVKRLDDLQLLDVPVHDFAIPPLTQSDVGAFIGYLRDQGVPIDDLPEQQLQGVCEVTGGQIGLVKQRLESREQPGEAPARPRVSVAGLPLAHVAALFLLVVVLLWALLAHEPEPEVATRAVELPAIPSTDQVDGAEAPVRSGLTEKTTAPKRARDDSVVGQLEPVVDDRELRNAIYGEPAPERPASQPVVEPRVDQSPQLQPEVAQEPVVQPPKEAPEAVVAPPPQPKVESSPRYDAGKLLAFDPDSYSLQVMAATSLASLERFRESQSNSKQLYLYRAQRQGRPWYLLVAGNYATKAAATDAIQRLPKAQRSAGPWPRKLESIHQEIEEDRRI